MRTKKTKKTKQTKQTKAPEARAAEVETLATQLSEVGLPHEITQPLVDDMRDFALTGQGFSKTVLVPCTPLAIVCLLSNQPHITSHIRITRVSRLGTR